MELALQKSQDDRKEFRIKALCASVALWLVVRMDEKKMVCMISNRYYFGRRCVHFSLIYRERQRCGLGLDCKEYDSVSLGVVNCEVDRTYKLKSI